ncbi:MAG: hypothetical protein M1837_003781 [Sclerophora amabilis]|nr:MAG: hypothetical protein M1837_003781 [Sclerophora amabilis]
MVDGEFWLFGYGSLIWKPPPHFDRRVPGYITGYIRRFWQVGRPFVCGNRAWELMWRIHSEDHRGTPEAPGRVVTLIERSFWRSLVDPHASAGDKVWGVAYRIASSKVEEVKAYLDIREINGYSIHHTLFHPPDASQPEIRPIVYIGTPDNPQFTGPQDPQALAEHIWRSRGPSGDNKEYLFMLEQSLDELCGESGDDHVRDLASRVRELERRTTTTTDPATSSHHISQPDHAAAAAAAAPAGEPQEEVEKR